MLRLVAVLLMPMLVSVFVVAEEVAEKCKSKGDVVFIVDESDSITAPNWVIQIEALKDLVDDYTVGPNDWQFGAVTFQYDGTIRFELNQHITSAAVKTALDDIPYTGGVTNIADGVRKARKVFENAGNRSGAKDIAVIFSDGAANREQRYTNWELQQLKDYGVMVVTVGIGPAHNVEQMTAAASHPSWYFMAEDYNGLTAVINGISGSVCDVSTNCTHASVGCEICTSDLKCKRCYPRYYLDGIDCEECSVPNCAECSSSNGCDVCDAGLTLKTDGQSSSCVDDTCRVTECTEGQTFDHPSCTCVAESCIVTECMEGQTFDHPSCTCVAEVCIVTQCMSGWIFDHPSCKCVKRRRSIDVTDPCYHCTYNAYGQGFAGDSNDTTCCMYYECWRTEGATDSTETLRNCPPGTWFNTIEGGNGNPCTNSKPNDTCADVCPAPSYIQNRAGPIIQDLGCMLYPNDNDHAEFGTCSAPSDNACPGSASFTKSGECMAGQSFDHPSCTCVGPLSPSNCVAAINLQNDIQDHSPMNGHIVASGSQVTFVTAIVPLGAAGVFSGQGGLTRLNGAALSGAFGGCSTKFLSVGVFFNAYDISDDGVVRGIVSYGRCDDQEEPSFGIYQQGNKAIAKAGGLTVTSNQDIVANQWYYASFTFQRRHGDLKLYLMSAAEWLNCRNDCDLCPAWDKRVTASTMTCIESRPCGLEVGWAGTSDDSQGFFNGAISQAQVYHGRNVNACHLPKCR